MTDDYLHKEDNKLVEALPIYLAAQVTMLLITYLDFPVYVEAYRLHATMTVTGWLGAWFVLFIFGLTIGVFLLIGKRWKRVLNEKVRGKLASGYLLGGIAGLVSLGLRFMLIMPAQYFYFIGGLIVLSILAYIVWNKRQAQSDEIFP